MLLYSASDESGSVSRIERFGVPVGIPVAGHCFCTDHERGCVGDDRPLFVLFWRDPAMKVRKNSL